MIKTLRKSFLKNDLGLKFFNLGIIFLPSAVLIGAILLLISLILSLLKKNKGFLKDRWNYPLLLATGLMLASCIKNTIFPIDIDLQNWRPNDIPEAPIINLTYWHISHMWISLINWIPLFICFWGFQEYLRNEAERELFAKSLIIGTIPVIISCIGQFWFGWVGPYQLFDGLIIWFLKPVGSSGVMGLFNNQNVAGFWLSSVFPFSLFLVLKKQAFNYKKIFTSITTLLMFYLTLLTSSRNALLGIVISCSILIKSKFVLIFFFIIILTYPLYLYILNYLPQELVIKLKFFIPLNLIDKTAKFDLSRILNNARIEIFSKTFEMISAKPFLGWGAATFPYIYIIYKGSFDAQHSHNLFLQLTYEFGLTLSLVLTTMVILLLIKSWAKIKTLNTNSNNLINMSWIAASITCFVLHISDITYYDLRVSLLIWILFAGLRSILRQKTEAESFTT